MEILRKAILPIPDNVNLSEQIKLVRHANDCSIEEQSMKLIFRVIRNIVLPSIGGFVAAPFESDSMKVLCSGCEREGPDDLLNPAFYSGVPQKSKKI